MFVSSNVAKLGWVRRPLVGQNMSGVLGVMPGERNNVQLSLRRGIYTYGSPEPTYSKSPEISI